MMPILKLSNFRQFLVVLFIATLLIGCLDPNSSPDAVDGDDDGGSAIVEPTTGGTLVSDDRRVFVQFPEGIVERPTSFKITRVSREAFPEQELMISSLYQIEPTRKLSQTVRVTVDLYGLNPGQFMLSDLYETGALALKEIVPGERPKYLPTIERAIEANDSTLHQVLLYNTDTLGGMGVFLHECYDLCYKAVDCNVFTDASNQSIAEKDKISECMSILGCPNDIDKMNSSDMQKTFDCAASMACEDSYGCCLEDPYCEGSVDGDVTDGDVTDGDVTDGDVTDGDVTDGDVTDGDVTDGDVTDGDVTDGDVTDGDVTDGDQPDFTVPRCEGDGECEEGVCVVDLRLDENGLGFCLPLSDSTLQLYVRGDNVWESRDGDPRLSCIGVEPSTSADGSNDFALNVKLDDWWDVANPEGISVELYYEFNLNQPAETATMDANGTASFAKVFANEWLVFKTVRESGSLAEQVIPTWHWGMFITKAKAQISKDTGIPIDLTVSPVSGTQYEQFASALGVPTGVPDGFGMVIGQVIGCRIEPDRAVANASVGFVETKPFVTGYFNAQFDNPVPSLTQTATNKNGLFVGLYMPPQTTLTPFAFGRLNQTTEQQIQLIALGQRGHMQLFANSVSIVRFNRFD